MRKNVQAGSYLTLLLMGSMFTEAANAQLDNPNVIPNP